MSSLNSEIKQAIDTFDTDKARNLLREGLKQSPDAETYYLAAQVAITSQQKKDFLDKAIALDPFHEGANELKENLGQPAKPVVVTPPTNHTPQVAPVATYYSAPPVTASGESQLEWYKLVLWFLTIILAGTVSWEVSWLIISGSSNSDKFSQVFVIGLGAGITGGLVAAIGQWLALRRTLKLTINYPLIVFGGWFIGCLVLWFLSSYLPESFRENNTSAPLSFAAAGLVIGVAQFIAIRKKLPLAYWYIPASGVGLALTYIVANNFYSKSTYTDNTLLKNALGLAIYGLITTGLIFWLITAKKRVLLPVIKVKF